MVRVFALTAALLLAALVAPAPAAARTSWRHAVDDRLERQDYVTDGPLIGVLTQPHWHKHHQDAQTISGPLVSWVESAGGRVVPIRYNAPWDEIEARFNVINGLILPVSNIFMAFNCFE